MHIVVNTKDFGVITGDAFSDAITEDSIEKVLTQVARGDVKSLQLTVDGDEVFIPEAILAQSILILLKEKV